MTKIPPKYETLDGRPSTSGVAAVSLQSVPTRVVPLQPAARKVKAELPVSQTAQPTKLRVVRSPLKVKITPTSSRSLLPSTQPTSLLQTLPQRVASTSTAAKMKPVYAKITPASSNAVPQQQQQPIFVQSQPLQQANNLSDPLSQLDTVPLLVDQSGHVITTDAAPTQEDVDASQLLAVDPLPTSAASPENQATAAVSYTQNQSPSNALSVVTSFGSAGLNTSANSNSSTDSK